MSDLFWPGDHRAGERSRGAFLEAMPPSRSRLTLVAGVARPTRGRPSELEPCHDDWLVEQTEAGGNPVIPLVEALRRGRTADVAGCTRG